jgi:eukaryotic-like serine/threonine-protein kinase
VSDTDKHERLYSIFSEACALPTEEQSAFLDRACGDDRDLRREIEELLAIDKDESSRNWRMDGKSTARASVGVLSTLAAGAAHVPERIGPYRLIEIIGEGGMGVVYRAEQENPRRDVALKVIRPGVATPRMLKRFELEAQTLGRLHHHGIAQVYEAGTFDSGAGPQPFFAMEFLEGMPLLEYAAEHHLGTRDRLELLIRICEAVEHAHSKCVIHRDLKPANIIVTGGNPDRTALTSDTIDLLGQPKVLDFGVARVTDSDIQATTISTDIGQLVGTLPYMSPEQVGGQPDDLDTRSDVYALGVIGYELLINLRPHELAGKSLPEAVRIIREDNPKRIGSINRTYRGDLETIIHKALEKEKHRRYQSPRELAEDLRRFLRNEPITARPPSAMYHLRKFAQRNRALVAGLSIALVAVFVGLAGAVWAQAERMAFLETAEMYRGQLKRALEPPEGGDPLRPQEVDRVWLTEATAFVDRRLRREPLEAAELRNLIGLNYLNLDDYELAHQQLAIALKARLAHLRPPNALIAESLHNMGRVLWHFDAFDEAEAYYRKALAMRQSIHGRQHPDVAETMTHIAACLRDRGELEEAFVLYQRALDMRYELYELSDDLREEIAASIAANYNNMAAGLRMAGRYEEAEETFRKALDIIVQIAPDSDDLRIARTKRWLGATLVSLGRFDESRQLLLESFDIQTRVRGRNNRYVAAILYELAVLSKSQHDVSQAIELADDALDIQRRVLGDHLETALTLELLGTIRLNHGDPSAAVEALWEALLIRKDRRRPDHPQLLRSRSLLFDAAVKINDPQQVEALLRPATHVGLDDFVKQADEERELLLKRLREHEQPLKQSRMTPWWDDRGMINRAELSVRFRQFAA